MGKSNNVLRTIAKSPLPWGAAASGVFYGLIHSGILTGDIITTYFASHPIEFAATTMFFIGLATLMLKLWEIVPQYGLTRESILGAPVGRGGTREESQLLLRRLDDVRQQRQGDYLVRRLRDAIEHVQRRTSADTLDEHLKYQADIEADRAHASYALVRVIIWAIPILGFLGTVIGITLAIANLEVAPSATSGTVAAADAFLAPTEMGEVTGPFVPGDFASESTAPRSMEDSLPLVIQGLSVAFATTTQALLLSILLMFALYFTERKEKVLLARVDVRTLAELEGHFDQMPSGPDGQLEAVRRMAETVVGVTERVVERQAQLWQKSMDEAAQRWSTMGDATGQQLQQALSGALAESLKSHAQQLAAVQRAEAADNHKHWDHIQQTQMQQTQTLASLQAAMTGQAEVLDRAVKATGNVIKLEDALNRNLSALGGSNNFEQTVMSLAATIHLLNARLSDNSTQASGVHLNSKKGDSQAA